MFISVKLRTQKKRSDRM